ncbi:MAG: heptaprenyl diphosphate synthase component [Bacillales bacterium]|jgi:heptaprenyl diphosphate synthase|nr:heptaprenyl diphosphate synthase component [Bacillales bacterium]
MKLQSILFSVNREISKIESILGKSLTTKQKVLHKASLKLLKSGGKRIRPVLVIIAGKFGQTKNDNILNVAATLELIHMASLVHDDVIDESLTRRNSPTVYAEHGASMSMYAGDFIFAKALKLMCNINNVKAHQLLSNTITQLCLGEIDQIRDKYNFNQNFRNYLRRINRKTAILISTSCELGGIVSEADPKIQQSLKYFGYYLGMSYQIIDDILDFTSDEKTLGKPAGGDLLQGNVTLPVLFAMRDEELSVKIRKVNTNMSKIDLDEILIDIKNSGAIEYSQEISDRYLRLALNQLESLPQNSAKDAFNSIALKLAKRKT